MIDPKQRNEDEPDPAASETVEGDDFQVDDDGVGKLVIGGKVYTISPAQPDDPIFNEGYRVTMKGSPAAGQDPEDSSPKKS